MAADKKSFLQKVTILHDSREQKNAHILDELDRLGISHRERKLDFGDYSFLAEERDFSLSCVIERKASIDELYGNLIADRGRLEKELDAASRLACQFVLLMENCSGMEVLREYLVPDWQMKAQNRKQRETGAFCAATLHSWQCGNRYRFRTVFVEDSSQTAARMLEEFYYFWRNYKLLTASRRNRT